MKANADLTLLDEQIAAIHAIEGVNVVLAGPGSGKTTVLVQRYLKMLTSGVPFDSMLNLTFTHGAALSMASRVGILDAKNVFRTFHSFALDMLKKERHRLPFKTCDTIIPVELQNYKLLFKLADIYPSIEWRQLENRIAGWKCECKNPADVASECIDQGEEYIYAMAYADYETKCREEGWLDFGSLMDEAVKMLEENEDVQNKYKRKYIAVDEAQDCDEIQFRLLQLLFNGNIFAVGDENQLIYEWRNARSGNLTNFARVFPGAKVLYLGTNHRSTGNIVEFLKAILPVDNGLASRMNTYNDAGLEIQLTHYRGEEEEAEEILKKIKDPLNTAIIARTNRQLFIYQRLLAMRGIKYNFLGKKDFWEQNEVKKLLEYASATRSKGPANKVLADIIAEKNMLSFYGRIGAKNPMESSPVENLTGLVKIADKKGTLPEFLEYVRKITHARKKAKALTLSTVHQAKGLEWDYVYVVGARQGNMPHKNGEIKEEHRILFVACSRPSKELHISFYDNLSQFLWMYEDKVQEHIDDNDTSTADDKTTQNIGSTKTVAEVPPTE